MDVATAQPPASETISIDPDGLNPIFEKTEPQKIVDWTVAQFGRDVIMSSSFGAESALLIHMATRAMPDIRIVMVDTGYLFPETYQFMEKLRLKWNLNVWVYRTKNDPIAYLRQAGEDNPTWRKDVDACCAVNKNEPFERAMNDLRPKAWLRGIRRYQADSRKNRQFVERSNRYDCWAISPLLNMTSKQIYDYMKRHELEFHPLYEKGYASIGCNPLSCTRPVGEGEDARSGRWSGQAKVECGINLTDSLDSAQI